MSQDYEVLYDRKSECCDALITETGFCTFCWEHALAIPTQREH